VAIGLSLTTVLGRRRKAYVTGLEAANLVIERFGRGSKANIIPVEPDEPHIQIARTINKTVRRLKESCLARFLVALKLRCAMHTLRVLLFCWSFWH
jgi:hypothetical protein